MSVTATEDREFSERQREVLDAALALIVENGSALTMSALARRASCSKETLYKWFGDRDGLLTATVQWQAAKVRGVPLDRERLDREALGSALERFAADWLRVISSSTSVALNRLAVGHAGGDTPDLGSIVLHNGPFAMNRRVRPLLMAGEAAGLLRFEDADAAFHTFFGLVVRDVQIRLLLGEPMSLSADEIAIDARRASQQFLALFGAPEAEMAGQPTPRRI
ncbi:TetR/AcrR family transcriptional regulator [Consotaella salsifontis]|uniref:Transcriptional regulator, TetR family n=1 Tax=Consotaella salsifontis TaxID=1365950 RepID=A0A1T4MJD8_9HYPH|nr:TetR/AcrR family transcriptional regulator [Consotaella salsifontis]SJZ67149.1 transcriptional regulator, TetR family [Consotaella salsifontis]